MKEFPKDTVDELKRQHGRVVQLTHPQDQDLSFIFKPPSPEAWKRFKLAAIEPEKRLQAQQQLVYDCLVYPDRAALDAGAIRLPALYEVFVGELVEEAGIVREVEKKVL